MEEAPENGKESPHSVHANGLIDNPSDHTMALGSTQPLTEMSTSSISWG